MLKKYVSVPLIAHGGAGDIDHIVELFQTCEVDGVALGSILHYSYLEKNILLDNQGKNYFINTENKIHDDKKITIDKIKKTLKKMVSKSEFSNKKGQLQLELLIQKPQILKV